MFHLFGQASYYPLRDRNKIAAKIRMVLPLMVLIVITVVCSRIYFENSDMNKNIYSKIWHIIKFSGFVPTYIVFYISITKPTLAWISIDRIHSILKFIQIRMSTRFSFNKFKWNCFRQFCVCGVVNFFSRSVTLHTQLKHPLRINSILAVSTMHAYKSVTIMHAVFHLYFF